MGYSPGSRLALRRRQIIAAAIAAGIAPAARAGGGPVVLELFTSQGCSSCPPADALLGQLARRPDVIALAWHVDYWDRLGWRDPYASREATERQRAYARQLNSLVYTPALVINGAKLVVGSDNAAIETVIEAAAALPVLVTLSRTEDGTVVEMGAAPGPVRVLRAVYDPEHATTVSAGENDGARLHEYRIVREVEALGEWDGSARRFATKAPGPGQGQVILLQSADLRVVGAAEQPPG
ncbi:MAG TPA: DUF1223 domain-containing protein [Acetobacteraceae bacterium]|jgi:hypothetical protein|nr:DUF1223 domain-containing protein [Acetobacteraceae bacterium]